MSEISAEDIKSGRERQHMTQKDLADELGVSLRTVGSWERGESVPRNRMAALAEVLGMEGTSEFGYKALLRQVGHLAKQRREEIGMGRQPFAKEAGLGSDKTLVSLEFGRVLPSGTSQRKIEKALGWRLGVIDDVMRMTNRKASDITMEELDAEDSLYLASRGGVDPLNKRPLRYVSSEDLLEEIRLRLESAAPPPRLYGKQKPDVKDMYGLAASTNVEHLEDEDDTK